MLFLIVTIIYIRCVWTNIYTRIGYGLLLLAAILLAFPVPQGTVSIATIIGALILVLTRFGFPTMSAYKRTIVHMEKREEPDDRFIAEATEAGYCYTQGFLLGVKDAFIMQEILKMKKKQARP